MNKKVLFFFFAVILLAAFASASYYFFSVYPEKQKLAEEQAVKQVVEGFGQAMKNVSLLSGTASYDIEKNYKDYVLKSMLLQWKNHPLYAVGRLTAIPWPDRIEIGSINKINDKLYEVDGKVIEVSSQEAGSEGVVATQQIKLTVIKSNNLWLIAKAELGEYSADIPWKTSVVEGIEFQYPEKLPAQYAFTHQWPPVIKIETKNYSCKKTSQKVISNKVYCVTVKNEGAAGSMYSFYDYITPKNEKLVLISFILRYPNCANYETERSQACFKERETFNIDVLIDKITETIKWGDANDNSLASQIKKCLPMSDQASKEKCEALLKQIDDFNSCVMAGFSVMKSNPPQCQTPDGRVFVE